MLDSLKKKKNKKNTKLTKNRKKSMLYFTKSVTRITKKKRVKDAIETNPKKHWMILVLIQKRHIMVVCSVRDI